MLTFLINLNIVPLLVCLISFSEFDRSYSHSTVIVLHIEFVLPPLTFFLMIFFVG